MSEQSPTSPDVALRAFLDVIASEAETNATFRNKLLTAIGAQIIFEGEDDIATADPVLLSVRYSEDAFRRIWGVLKAADLKALLVAKGLASKEDVKPLKKVPELLAVLWSRARERAEELGKI